MRATLVFLLLSITSACATHGPATGGITYVLMRHAEKAQDDPRDPSLSDAGRGRVQRLVQRLHREPVVAVYATGFRRTQLTAAPVAQDHALPVSIYDANTSADDMARILRHVHRAGTVVVIGHSNTVPALAAALCGCLIGPTAESEFGRRITVHIDEEGHATLDDRREP